jgi:glucose-1-phosphate adenylyltransferase
MSNCINSGLSKIYILTQFNSTSLNRHLARTYNFGAGGVRFGGEGFVEVLAATQTPTDKEWFQGTADAVRQYAWLFDDIKNRSVTDIVILSGDHLYRMDYMKFVDHHRATGADITIGCLPCDEARASDFGLMKINAEGRIVEFAEKPKGEALRAMQVDTTVLGLDASDAKARPYIASMGIYVFKKETMLELLRGDATMNDFGGEIIPQAAQHKRVQAYLFDGYWEDIGTIESFFEANLALTENVSDALEPLRRAACWGGGRDPAARRGPGARLHAWAPPPGTTTHLGLDLGALTAPALPPPPLRAPQPPKFEFHNPEGPIYTSPRFLPPAKIIGSSLKDAIVSHGAYLEECTVDRAIVGLRSRVERGARIENAMLMGADYYESDAQRAEPLATGGVPIGIGARSHLRRCIIDKNARIGEDCQIINKCVLGGTGLLLRCAAGVAAAAAAGAQLPAGLDLQPLWLCARAGRACRRRPARRTATSSRTASSWCCGTTPSPTAPSSRLVNNEFFSPRAIVFDFHASPLSERATAPPSRFGFPAREYVRRSPVWRTCFLV